MSLDNTSQLGLATADIGRLLIFQVEGSCESEECSVITFDGYSPTTYWKFTDQQEQRKYTLYMQVCRAFYHESKHVYIIFLVVEGRTTYKYSLFFY